MTVVGIPAQGRCRNDWSYPPKAERRNVIAWSRSALELIDVATPGAANGRLLVASTTVTDVKFTIVGVCIPWSMTDVSTGRRDRGPWDEHREF